MAKKFIDAAFSPIPKRTTPHRVTRAPKLRPRSLRQALKEGIGGLKGRQRFSGPAFIQRSREMSSEQKAIFHNITGAGRSRVFRRFMGLTAIEQEKVRGILGGLIDQRVKAFNSGGQA
jgi:hypothetical protein